MLHSADCTTTSFDMDVMRSALENDPSLIEKPQSVSTSDDPPTLPLHHAVTRGHAECVELLINSGANVDSIDPVSGHTSLELAIINSNCNIVQLLLKNGASPNYLWNNVTRTRYLELAVERTLNNIIKILLESGAETEDFDCNENGEKRLKINYESPLINSLWDENTAIFHLLCYHGSCLECYYNDKNSIPHIIIASYVSAEETITALTIYQQFGGNLWVLQPDLEDRTDVPETALQSLRREPCLYTFKGEPKEIDNHLEHLMSNPLNLQSLCRIAIFKIIGRPYYKIVSKLPLPKQIIYFLKFKDIFNNDLIE